MEIKRMRPEDCVPGLLKDFERHQEVKRCVRFENGEWVLKDIVFIEHWNEEEKAEQQRAMRTCVENGGAAFGAYLDDALRGFAYLPNRLFGSENEYVQLKEMQVSNGFRGHGIGRRLFGAVCAVGRELGAKKLYISAHSSEETQGFYMAMGCVDAKEIDQGLYALEPYDRHMEYVL